MTLKIDAKRRQYEQARQAGESARRAGQKASANPWKFGGTPLMHDLRDEWAQGWMDADMAIRMGKRS